MKDGFYSVKFCGGWTVAERDSSMGWWMVVGSDIPHWIYEVENTNGEPHFDEIGPRLDIPLDD